VVDQPVLATSVQQLPETKSDYPLIKFWHKRDWTVHQKAKKEVNDLNRVPPKRGNVRAAKGENVMMLYVEDSNGTPINGNRAAEICKLSRALFAQFSESGVAPKTWSKASITTIDFYKQEMRNRFPELRLCESNWKIDQIATDTYPSWHTYYTKQLAAKQEPEEMDLETPTLKRPVEVPPQPSDRVLKKSRPEPTKGKGKERDTGYTFEVCSALLVPVNSMVNLRR
jgi:hypothetical protein